MNVQSGCSCRSHRLLAQCITLYTCTYRSDTRVVLFVCDKLALVKLMPPIDRVASLTLCSAERHVGLWTQRGPFCANGEMNSSCSLWLMNATCLHISIYRCLQRVDVGYDSRTKYTGRNPVVETQFTHAGAMETSRATILLLDPLGDGDGNRGSHGEGAAESRCRRSASSEQRERRQCRGGQRSAVLRERGLSLWRAPIPALVLLTWLLLLPFHRDAVWFEVAKVNVAKAQSWLNLAMGRS